MGTVVKGCAVIFGLLIIAGIIGSLVGQAPDSGPGAVTTTAPGATSGPTAAPTTAAPTAPPTPTPSQIVLSGRGSFATDPIMVPFVANATFTHDGARNFIVTQHQGGDEHLLVNTIGGYEGTRPLWSRGQTLDEPSLFDIQADGAWTMTIRHIECCVDDGTFEGRGDAVSAGFLTLGAAPRPWELRHDGGRNFIVYLHCEDSRRLVVKAIVVNAIGALEGSTIVTLSGEWCIWEVRADGAWSLRPR